MNAPLNIADCCTVLNADCIEAMATMPEKSVHCCVTSPPYFGLRDYGHEGQIGLEPTPDEFVAKLVAVFREVWRVLRDDGTLWLNLGDSYNSFGGVHAGRSDNQVGVGAGQRQWREGSARADGEVRSDGMSRRNRDGTHAPGLKAKDLIGIPWRVAFALQADGWYLRQDIIWHKPNPMPESVTDRCTKAHEYIFLLSKSERYYFDSQAMKEPSVCGYRGSEFHTGKTGEHQLGRAQKIRPSAPKGSFNGKTEAMADTGQNAFRAVTEFRNRRSVWTVNTQPYKGAHFATFPPALIEPCILAGSSPGGIVLDPFIGSGTTAMVSLQLGRKYLGCELNREYEKLQIERINGARNLFTEAA